MKPCRSICSLTLGLASAAAIALFMVATISGGRSAGPTRANHGPIGNGGWPASTSEGTSGISGLRAGNDVESARSLPAFTCARTAVEVPFMSVTRPDSRSVIASGSDL